MGFDTTTMHPNTMMMMHPPEVVVDDDDVPSSANKKRKHFGTEESSEVALEAPRKDDEDEGDDNDMEHLVRHWIGRPKTPPAVIAKVPSTISFYADTSCSTTDNETLPPSLKPSELSSSGSNLTEDDEDFYSDHHHHIYEEQDNVAVILTTHPAATYTTGARWTDTTQGPNVVVPVIVEDSISKDLQNERERLKAEFEKAFLEEEQQQQQHATESSTVQQPDLSFGAFLRYACYGELFT